MTSDAPDSRFVLALTQATLGAIPPELQVATDHNDEVMLFMIRVADARAATDILMDVINLSESKSILAGFRATGGLIRKPFHIDDALRLKDELEATGAVVEFVRPDDV